MKRKIPTNLWLLVFVFLMSSFTVLQAQNTTVTGIITDSDDGTTLIGVAVMEKGTTNGAITDLDGQYFIAVKEGAILSFSYVGYETVERAADQEKIDVAMKVK